MTIDRQLESGATRGPLSAEEKLDALDDIARKHLTTEDLNLLLAEKGPTEGPES
jgi:hypothetical protein